MCYFETVNSEVLMADLSFYGRCGNKSHSEHLFRMHLFLCGKRFTSASNNMCV